MQKTHAQAVDNCNISAVRRSNSRQCDQLEGKRQFLVVWVDLAAHTITALEATFSGKLIRHTQNLTSDLIVTGKKI
jgi:hypothetical protein